MTPRREELSDKHVGRVYRALADEHALRTAKLREEETWRRISEKAMSHRSSWLAEAVAGWTASFRGALRGRGLVPALVGAALLGVVLVWLGTRGSHPSGEPFTFEVDGSTVSSRWIHAETESVSLRFSDGSAVRLQPNSELGVSLVGEGQARLRVEEGSLAAHVVHAEATDWRFSAGPYEVRVVGTKFDLTWDGGLLQLQMHDGSVEVHGPDNGRWTASGTQRLELGTRVAADQPVVAEQEGQSDDAASGESVTAKHTRRAARRGVAGGELGSLRSPTPSLREDAKRTPSWSEMLAAGRFTEILTAATAEGLERALTTRSASELSALAQAARYAKRPVLSERAWTALQQRFSSSPMAKDAGFFLGRVAEQRGQASSALRQYRAYLNGKSSGQYTAEALGGMMRLLRTSSPAEAARYADRYLASFPTGPYVRLARELIARSSLGK